MNLGNLNAIPLEESTNPMAAQCFGERVKSAHYWDEFKVRVHLHFPYLRQFKPNIWFMGIMIFVVGFRFLNDLEF
jgi:hypothetical protein